MQLRKLSYEKETLYLQKDDDFKPDKDVKKIKDPLSQFFNQEADISNLIMSEEFKQLQKDANDVFGQKESKFK